MKSKTSKLSRLTLTAVSILCLGASVFAGPSPMFIMINHKMMMLTPMTSDVKLKNGCTVCAKGVVINANGTTTTLNDGDMVTATGRMIPAAKSTHGG